MITRSQVKYIQSLSEKKSRNDANAFVAEGPKIINEFLINGAPELVALYGTDKWQTEAKELRLPYDQPKFTAITDSELKSISFLSTPNQVLGIFHQTHKDDNPVFEKKLSLVLDGIQDPGNFGTIVRIADWYGIGYIIAGGECADAYNPKVVQSTMGSIARVKIVYETLASFLEAHANIPVYASALHGKPFRSFSPIEEGFLIIGNESKGISEALLAAASHHLTIPRYGHAESLNAAVATGILLSALKA